MAGTLPDRRRDPPWDIRSICRTHRSHRVERTNVGAAGENGELYKEVLETISVPQHLLDQAYGSRYARHFYTESELDQLRSKWAALSRAVVGSGSGAYDYEVETIPVNPRHFA